MTSPRRLTALISLGASLEYYDFVIYGFMAAMLSQIFFPKTDSLAALIEVFGIFAMGYVVRPLGGLLFGSLGDRFGRKNIFLISMLVMACSTFAMGLLPSYQQIGTTAAFLLLICRIFQGLAFGAEMPGMSTFLVEHLQTHRSRYTGFGLASVSLGALLGSLIPYLLNLFFTQAQILAYAWRLPFLLGGLLAWLSYFIRKKIQETPAFLAYSQLNKEKHPIKILFQQYKKQIFLGILLTLFSACFIIFGVGMPAFLQKFYHYQIKEIYLVIAVGYIWSALTLPFLGSLADKIGRAMLLFSATAVFIITSALLFYLLTLQHLSALLLFILLYQTFISAFATSYLPLLAELFPTSVRFTGSAMCYNIVFSIAGFTPATLNLFVNWSGVQHSYIFFVLLAMITLVSSLLLILNSSMKKPAANVIS